MAVTEAQLEAMESTIITALHALATSPKPTYQVGSRKMNWNEYQRELRENLKAVQAMKQNLPGEAVYVYDDPNL